MTEPYLLEIAFECYIGPAQNDDGFAVAAVDALAAAAQRIVKEMRPHLPGWDFYVTRLEVHEAWWWWYALHVTRWKRVLTYLDEFEELGWEMRGCVAVDRAEQRMIKARLAQLRDDVRGLRAELGDLRRTLDVATREAEHIVIWKRPSPTTTQTLNTQASAKGDDE